MFSHNGSQSVYAPFVASDHDEWLISPSYDLTQVTDPGLKFWWFTSYSWMVSPINNADIILHVSTDSGGTWTQLWSEQDTGRFLDWEWYQTEINLAAYASETDVMFALQYVGNDATDIYIDEFQICQGTVAPAIPSLNMYGIAFILLVMPFLILLRKRESVSNN